MLLDSFSDRAQECVRLAMIAKRDHDRKFFLALARAFYGALPFKGETVRFGL